jgi:pimeloyl-ACP methyl ester carboxylesterase
MLRFLVVAALGIGLGLAAVAILARVMEPRLAFFPLKGEQATPRDYGVAFEAVEVRTSDGERLRAWWIDHPSPRADVLYLHGNGGNLAVWTDILLDVHRQGFALFALDYRGYGLSSGRPSEQGLYRDVEAAVAAFGERARGRGRPVIYWGRSLGAAMAAWAARVRPPDGLILESGFPDVASLLAGSPLAFLARVTSYRFPAAEWVQAFEGPVLVLHGNRDSVIPYEQGRRLFDRLPRRDRSRFVTIAGGDHNDPVPRDPDTYWAAVGDLVDAAAREASAGSATLPRQHEER